MHKVFSILAGAEVDSSSETWRHECECKWLLTNKPTRTMKHQWLYGVNDRRMIVNHHTGELISDWKRIAEKSIVHLRGLAAADKMLADAKKIYEYQQNQTTA